jgi:hypothetical protein
MTLSKNNVFYVLALLYVLLTFFCRSNIFFGDMVQFASRHPHFFLANQFQTIYLPNYLDSGHPPLFGIYIAFAWFLFGKSLLVSHFAMLPFLLLIAYQVPQLLSRWLSGYTLLFSSLLVLLEPTLLAQATLVSPDIVLMAIFITSINLFFNKKYKTLALILIPLGLISLRGMMVLFASFCAIILNNTFAQRKFNHHYFFTIALVFLPSVIIATVWLWLHYQHTGWIGFHSDSPWASSFQQVSFAQMLKNALLFIWRLVDFGRITVWLLALFLLFKLKFAKQSNLKLSISIVVFILVFAANTLFADGLVGHRYFLPIYFLTLVFVLKNIAFAFPKNNKFAFAMLFLSFLIGATFVYPSKIAMGWDATPAHLPYYSLRKDAIAYLNNNNIPLQAVASGFPNLDSREILELNGDSSHFNSYSDTSLKYILYSNVFNYPDSLIDKIENTKAIYYQKKGFVFIGVYAIAK